MAQFIMSSMKLFKETQQEDQFKFMETQEETVILKILLPQLADKALLWKLKNFHAIQVLQTLPDQVNQSEIHSVHHQLISERLFFTSDPQFLNVSTHYQHQKDWCKSWMRVLVYFADNKHRACELSFFIMCSLCCLFITNVFCFSDNQDACWKSTS